jgi:hypothetical protein
VRRLAVPGADVDHLRAGEPQLVAPQVIADRRHLQIDPRGRLGVRVAQRLGQRDQLGQILQVGREVLLIALIIDRLERVFLAHELAVHLVADRPPVLAVLAVPLALPRRALLDAAGLAEPALDHPPPHRSTLSRPALTCIFDQVF